MRRNKLYSLVALLACTAASTTASHAHAQGLADVRAVKPLVMLLVDTSGSMERLPDVGTQIDKLPVCTNTASDSAQKNRWAVTLEALTGSFSNFRCVAKDRKTYANEFDENYFLPHYDFTSNATYATQVSDGVLDSFKNRLKFGLMTFDGVATTVEGETLVDYTKYGLAGSTVRTDVLGRAGMYSYPDSTESASGYGWKKLFFPGCTTDYGVNVGARGKGTEPGSLISVGVSDNSSDILTVNQTIQESLLKVRPYGGTPIAGMLDDLRYYLKNDADVKRGGDPYYECRSRFAILLTDGAPDDLYRGGKFNCQQSVDATRCSGKDCCPYDSDADITHDIRYTDKTLDKLWVVAFNVNDTSSIVKLNKIAQEGASIDALSAATPTELRQRLSDLMNIIQPNSTSRSVPVMMNTGKPVLLGGRQFEVIAGFKVGQYADEPWQGMLYRRRITCEGAAAKPQPFSDSYADGTVEGNSDMFHEELKRRSPSNDRTLFTIHAKPVAVGTSAMRGNLYAAASNTLDSAAYTGTTANAVKPDGSTFAAFSGDDATAVSSQTLVDDGVVTSNFDTSTPVVYFGDADKNGTPGEASDRNLINQYLRGLTDNRKSRPLGDIYHSNPVVLPPLMAGSEYLNVFDPNLRKFYQDLIRTGTGETFRYGAAGRPGVVFVGTNDGILHAFNLDTWTSKAGTKYKPGYEFWGFVPPALFDKLAPTVAPSHQVMFDGTPVVQDVMYMRPLSSGTTKSGTVLISAVRGAPAYVALDVTYPESPTFLWQRSFKYLGNTVATPAIGHVKVNWGGQDQIRAVAVLPGGEGELNTASTSCAVNDTTYARGKAPSGRDNVRCWKVRGRSLYVVDVATGELLQEFDARHFHSPMTGSVAVDGEGFELTRAAYMTDEDGILWRLSMVNTDPAKWRVIPLIDLFSDSGSPAVKDLAGSAASVPTPTATSGRVAPYAPVLTRNPKNGNLTILVGTGDIDNLTDNVPHRVFSIEEARAFGSTGELAGSVTANWKLQLDKGESVTGPLVVYDQTLYFATFKGPGGSTEDLCAMGSSRIVGAHVRETASGQPKPMLLKDDGKTFELYTEPNDAKNSLLLGLSIARDPVCIEGSAVTDPNSSTPYRYQQSGASGGGTYTLHSMVATSSTPTSGTVAPISGSDLRQVTRTLPIPNIVRSVGWASSVE